MSERYKAYQDLNSINVKFSNATKELIKEYQHQKEREEDRQWIYSRVMNSINYNLYNTATPAIEKIADQINSLLK